MRCMSCLSLFGVILSVIPVRAQQSPQVPSGPPPSPYDAQPTEMAALWTPHPVRDADAVQVIQMALNALGGTAAISQVQSCTISGQAQISLPKQTRTGNFVWRVSGNEYRGDMTSSSLTTSMASGHGNPFEVLADGTSTAVPATSARVYIVPPMVAAILLKEIQDSNYSLLYSGASSLGAEPVTIIKTSSQATAQDSWVTSQTWYFDAASGLPVRIEYSMPDIHRPERRAPVAYNLLNYQTISGVLYPFKIVKTVVHTTEQVLTVSSIQPNSQISSSVFDFPAGGAQ